MYFTNAIVRIPGESFADGLTSMQFGLPDIDRALAQHASYREALNKIGLRVTELPPDPNFPDSTFVEDTAVLTSNLAVLTRPGAPSREGEVGSIHRSLLSFYDRIKTIEFPGTVDGGDICQADNKFFIGLSDRTNESGAQQLRNFLTNDGYEVDMIDIRGLPDLLHLKSGLSYVGERNMVLVDSLLAHPAFDSFHKIKALKQENYAVNCVRIKDYILFAAGFPILAGSLESLGYQLIQLEVSEFRKMDGGLSCLSLRF